MRELSLFTGAGGGVLGSTLLGHQIIGAVEFNEYCCKVLEKRQKDGILDRFPIFQTDIRDFVREGYAELYKGKCDLVSGGFPCQPFSVAGKRQAENDDRNMWPAVVDVIRAVRPKYVFLENVPGLLPERYIQRIFGDLAEAGFDASWCVLGADDLGAPHRRKRLWIYATNTNSEQQPVSVNDCIDQRSGKASPQRAGHITECGEVANTVRGGSSESWWAIDPSHTTKEGHWEVDRAFDGGRWGVESPVGRVANGVADRMEQLKAIGNGQVPIVAATAFKLLSGIE